ncbi:hypothetical protein D3C84_1062250 [compost metagenome]
MAARVGAAGAEGAHDAGEAFGPVAGTERAAFGCQALDNDFVWITDHGLTGRVLEWVWSLALC